MPRRKRTSEEIARKAKVRELIQELDINDMSGSTPGSRYTHRFLLAFNIQPK